MSDILPATGVTREKIIDLQYAMLPILCQPPEPNHYFAKGMYLRELLIPAGMTIVGKTHRHEHFLIVTKGRAEVVSEFGKMTVESGHISVSPPGVKRAIYAIEDTHFINVHVNADDERDTDKLEEMNIIEEPEFLALAQEAIKCLGQ